GLRRRAARVHGVRGRRATPGARRRRGPRHAGAGGRGARRRAARPCRPHRAAPGVDRTFGGSRMGGSVTRSVLCWVDAGPVFGLGHVSRALALAEALSARGVVCHFVLSADATALAWLAAAGMPPPILL